MKKFVTLIVVLGMVSVANAAPVLTIGGTPVSTVTPTNITLFTSETIELDIEVDSGFFGGNLGIHLSNAQASLNAAGVWLNPFYRLMNIAEAPWDFPWSAAVGNDAQNYGITGGNFSNPNTDTRTLMNGLILHCDSGTDLTVQLVADGIIDYGGQGDIPQGTILGTINITQIPEPATIVLLGLGGLLLRRRK